MLAAEFEPRSDLRAGTAHVAVAVCTSDPLASRGAASMLAGDDRVRVLDEDEVDQADVIVVIVERVDEVVLASLREMRAASTSEWPPRCVVFTDHPVSELPLSAIECGMAAVLPRGSVGSADVVQVVLAVGDGAAYLPPKVQGRLLTHLDRISRDMLEPHGLTLSGLSAKERDVIRLLAAGHSTEEIALELAYSVSTVKNVLYGLMRRHDLNTRAHAVAFALRNGAI